MHFAESMVNHKFIMYLSLMQLSQLNEATIYGHNSIIGVCLLWLWTQQNAKQKVQCLDVLTSFVSVSGHSDILRLIDRLNQKEIRSEHQFICAQRKERKWAHTFWLFWLFVSWFLALIGDQFSWFVCIWFVVNDTRAMGWRTHQFSWRHGGHALHGFFGCVICWMYAFVFIEFQFKH